MSLFVCYDADDVDREMPMEVEEYDAEEAAEAAAQELWSEDPGAPTPFTWTIVVTSAEGEETFNVTAESVTTFSARRKG